MNDWHGFQEGEKISLEALKVRNLLGKDKNLPFESVRRWGIGTILVILTRS
jgi:hypothetical protein